MLSLFLLYIGKNYCNEDSERYFLENENFSLNCAHNNNNDPMQDINRLKLVLVEKKRTNKWLSEQLGINPSTVSKWCTNSSQPDLETLIKIASLLEVNVQDLLNTPKV